MKKTLLEFGKTISKSEQKEIHGGRLAFVACGCSSDYILEGGEFVNGRECSFVANGTAWGDPFPGGRCFGTVVSGQCCV